MSSEIKFNLSLEYGSIAEQAVQKVFIENSIPHKPYFRNKEENKNVAPEYFNGDDYLPLPDLEIKIDDMVIMVDIKRKHNPMGSYEKFYGLDGNRHYQYSNAAKFWLGNPDRYGLLILDDSDGKVFFFPSQTKIPKEWKGSKNTLTGGISYVFPKNLEHLIIGNYIIDNDKQIVFTNFNKKSFINICKNYFGE